jgi:hypothetical protein
MLRGDSSLSSAPTRTERDCDVRWLGSAIFNFRGDCRTNGALERSELSEVEMEQILLGR